MSSGREIVIGNLFRKGDRGMGSRGIKWKWRKEEEKQAMGSNLMIEDENHRKKKKWTKNEVQQ